MSINVNRARHGLLMLVLGLFAFNASAASSSVQDQLEAYASQGADVANAGNGKRLWTLKNGQRSCSSCHGESAREVGRHVKTGKVIQPMALSVNGERYGNAKKVEKWFRRNCKWTFGRACSVQEKADMLTWLANE